MPIKSVYIDNNVWDFLFARQMDLSVELPADRYCLCMTREAEFEIPPIPEEKADLKQFIQEAIRSCVRTVPFFGFFDESLPTDEQRHGGFDQGRFASLEELDFINQQRTTIGSRKKEKTKLYPNEADVSVAARSFESIVLTLDRKKGPINSAYQQGGQIVFLTEFDGSGLSLMEYVEAKIVRRQP
ncbi:hypothetical protein ABKS89_13590 [Pseudomonas sp. LABIM340]|uniref:hypothetical protein n=1 Tax=Pseudomonas sp. LABIM340 TaxID=3156585 RepID=UPI0032AEAF38